MYNINGQVIPQRWVDDAIYARGRFSLEHELTPMVLRSINYDDTYNMCSAYFNGLLPIMEIEIDKESGIGCICII